MAGPPKRDRVTKAQTHKIAQYRAAGWTPQEVSDEMNITLQRILGFWESKIADPKRAQNARANVESAEQDLETLIQTARANIGVLEKVATSEEAILQEAIDHQENKGKATETVVNAEGEPITTTAAVGAEKVAEPGAETVQEVGGGSQQVDSTDEVPLETGGDEGGEGDVADDEPDPDRQLTDAEIELEIAADERRMQSQEGSPRIDPDKDIGASPI